MVNSPIYSTGVGLVLYGGRQGERLTVRNPGTNLFVKVRSRMAEWFAEHF